MKARLFTLTISAAGTFALVYSLRRLYLEPTRLDWILVLALTMLLSWRAEVWIPGIRSKITLTDTFVCMAMLLLGPWAAAVLASIDGLSRSARGSKTNPGATALINMSAMNLSVLSASLLAERLFGPLDGLLYGVNQLDKLVLAIGVITLTNYLVNSSITAMAVAFFRGFGVARTWIDNYLWTSPAFFHRRGHRRCNLQGDNDLRVLFIRNVNSNTAADVRRLSEFSGANGDFVQAY